MKKWSETRMQRAIRRAKGCAVGRVMCRLAGDKAGGVMLEYVVLGVLVAVAVVALVAVFGKDIGRGISEMSASIWKPSQAGTIHDANKKSSEDEQDAAQKEVDKFDSSK